MYFNLINPLKYSQPHEPIPSTFSPALNGLTITAYSAGHTLGGTIWHIQHMLESIVYSVDWNQAKEHVLSGAAWLGGAGAGGAKVAEQLRRPTAMVCSTRGAERVALAGGLRRRDELLLGLVKDTIRNGGTVLIPTDSSARVLELAYLLEDAWQNDETLRRTMLCLASSTCGATMRYARSMLEWMEEGIVREFEEAAAKPNALQAGAGGQPGAAGGTGSTPFDFKHVQLLERKSQVTKVLSRSEPKVVLASDSSLEWGFGRQALRKIADDSRNLVILTQRANQSKSGTKELGRYLWDLYEERSGENTDANSKPVDLSGAEVCSDAVNTQSLEANDMPLYQQHLARQRQMQNTLQQESGTTLETSADIVDERSEDSSEDTSDDEDEHQGKVLNVSAALSHSRHKLGLSDAELGIDVLTRRKGVYDYDVRGKKGREKLFPHMPKRRRQDDFGDIIRPEEYLRAEERDEVEGEDMRGQSMKENTVGQKRKWDNSAAAASNKRRKSGDGIIPQDALGDAMHIIGDINDDDEDDTPAVPEGPQKLVRTTWSFQLYLRIAYVDFAGLHDKRSLQMIIPLVRPRKLILIGGEEGETLALAKDCRKLLSAGESAESIADVFTPANGVTVDASVDTNAWEVKLSRPLVKRLNWQNVRGLGVVAVTARLGAVPAEHQQIRDANVKKKKLKMIKGESEEAAPESEEEIPVASIPILDVLPVSMAAATRIVAQPLHVGDLRLADLRKLMQSSGYAAEFRGEGILLIDGIVAVRKSGTGKIEVETIMNAPVPGKQGSTFWEVKRKIYEGLAVVAGG